MVKILSGAHKVISAALVVMLVCVLLSTGKAQAVDDEALINISHGSKQGLISLRVGDTFTYHVRLHVKDTACAFGIATYYNQPGKTKYEGEIPEENRVLSLVSLTPSSVLEKEGQMLTNPSKTVENVAIVSFKGGDNFKNTSETNLADENGALVYSIKFKVDKPGVTTVWTEIEQALKFEGGVASMPVSVKEDSYIINELEGASIIEPVTVGTMPPGGETAPSTTQPKPKTIGVYGDVTEDGEVDVTDVLVLSKHVAKLVTLTADKALLADVSCDGEIDIYDVLMVQRFVAKIPSSPTGELLEI